MDREDDFVHKKNRLPRAVAEIHLDPVSVFMRARELKFGILG
jgi:hypothetical protein